MIIGIIIGIFLTLITLFLIGCLKNASMQDKSIEKQNKK